MSEATAVSPQTLETSRRLHEGFLEVKRSRSDEYGGFGEVRFDSALHSISEPFRPYQGDSDYTEGLVEIGAPTLAANFGDEILPTVIDIIRQERLAKLLEKRALAVIVGPHIHFADVPIAQAAWLKASVQEGIYPGFGESAGQATSVVSRFIDTLAADLTNGSAIEGGIRHLGHVVKTIPASQSGLEATKDITKSQRDEHNDAAKQRIVEKLEEPGNVVFLAAEGTHARLANGGKDLHAHRVNEETAGLLYRHGAGVLALAVKCVPVITNRNIAPDHRAMLEPVGLEVPSSRDEFDKLYAELMQSAADHLPDYDMPNLKRLHFGSQVFSPASNK